MITACLTTQDTAISPAPGTATARTRPSGGCAAIEPTSKTGRGCRYYNATVGIGPC